MSDKLKPCPFCDSEEIEVERVGTVKASCIMACMNCGCRLESNEIGSGSVWNTRPEKSLSAWELFRELEKKYYWKFSNKFCSTFSIMKLLESPEPEAYAILTEIKKEIEIEKNM